MSKILILIVSVIFIFTLGSGKTLAQLDGYGNAPDFTLTDIDGTEHHLYEYLDSGKVVLVDFFAVWCGICRSNTPVLDSIYKEYGPEGNKVMELLSLEADPSTTDQGLIDFIELFESSNPHFNETGNVGALYNVTGFPFYYVVAPDRSYKVFTGTTMNLEDELLDAIETSPGLREIENDIRIVGFTEPKGTYCEMGIFPEIELQNYGKNDVTELLLNVEIDGVLEYTQQFSELLLPYEYSILELPELEDLEQGWHEFEVSVSSVNSNSDGEDNNDINSGYFLYLVESENVVIQVTTDTYPAETFWQVSEEGKVAAERLSFNKAKTLFTDTLCLQKDHCYTLNLFDRFSDGLSEGGVKVLYNGKTIVELDAALFNSGLEQIEFCISSTSSVNRDLISLNPDVFPNPASEIINIIFPDVINGPISFYLLNVQGQVVFEEHNAGALTKKTLNLSAFSDGIIFLRIAFANRSITKKIFIQK